MAKSEESAIIWTDYFRYRVELRGFDLSVIENILRHSTEKYFDTATQRMIAVGRHNDTLVMIPYEEQDDKITPVTIHATTRQQINFRIKTGRFTYE